MKWVELKVGDDAYIYPAEKNGKLSKGKVVHTFKLDWDQEHYVIELPTHVEHVYEVRNGFTVSDSQERPIGMYRR